MEKLWRYVFEAASILTIAINTVAGILVGVGYNIGLLIIVLTVFLHVYGRFHDYHLKEMRYLSKYQLGDIFNFLKEGRTKEEQEYLEDCIIVLGDMENNVYV